MCMHRHLVVPIRHPFSHPLSAASEVLHLLERGAASRHTAATRLNDQSSRSHMALQAVIESTCVEEGTGVVRRTSKLRWGLCEGLPRATGRKLCCSGGCAARLPVFTLSSLLLSLAVPRCVLLLQPGRPGWQ